MTHPAVITNNGQSARLEAVDAAGCCGLYLTADQDYVLRREGAPLLDWGLDDSGRPYRSLHGPWQMVGTVNVRKSIEKVYNRPIPPKPGMGGGSAFHGTDYLDPEFVNKDPARHSDRRDIEQNIRNHRPRKPGARRSSSDLIDAPGATDPVSAALSNAPDPLMPGHEEMARRAFKSATPAIAIGSRWFGLCAVSDAGERLYTSDPLPGRGNFGRGFLKVSASGALLGNWTHRHASTRQPYPVPNDPIVGVWRGQDGRPIADARGFC